MVCGVLARAAAAAVRTVDPRSRHGHKLTRNLDACPNAMVAACMRPRALCCSPELGGARCFVLGLGYRTFLIRPITKASPTTGSAYLARTSGHNLPHRRAVDCPQPEAPMIRRWLPRLTARLVGSAPSQATVARRSACLATHPIGAPGSWSGMRAGTDDAGALRDCGYPARSKRWPCVLPGHLGRPRCRTSRLLKSLCDVADRGWFSH
jgi:hypothetical protein